MFATSDQWHTPSAQNDLRRGGKLSLVMGVKDGSFRRRTDISFTGLNPVTITETFEPNDQDSAAMQGDFCEAILASFKGYAEAAINDGKS